jgi:hypothetical protein
MLLSWIYRLLFIALSSLSLRDPTTEISMMNKKRRGIIVPPLLRLALNFLTCYARLLNICNTCRIVNMANRFVHTYYFYANL